MLGMRSVQEKAEKSGNALVAAFDTLLDDAEALVDNGAPASVMTSFIEQDRDQLKRLREQELWDLARDRSSRRLHVALILVSLVCGLVLAAMGSPFGVIPIAASAFQIYLLHWSVKEVERCEHMLKEYDRLESRLDDLSARLPTQEEVN